jgi:hypothetical protein
MASKFAQFLTDNGIDPRRVLSASRVIERLRPEDRALRLARRRARSAEAGSPASKEKTAKPRSGRSVSVPLMAAAQAGTPISGAAKTRLLRAVNRVLELKKKPKAELKALF